MRIIRDPVTLMHPDVLGLYPCGEGAGYAGGSYQQPWTANLSLGKCIFWPDTAFSEVLILDVALLRLRSKHSCGLVSDQNLHFPLFSLFQVLWMLSCAEIPSASLRLREKKRTELVKIKHTSHLLLVIYRNPHNTSPVTLLSLISFFIHYNAILLLIYVNIMVSHVMMISSFLFL